MNDSGGGPQRYAPWAGTEVCDSEVASLRMTPPSETGWPLARSISAAEALLLTAVAGLTVIAISSLAMAHAHRFSLGAVAGVSLAVGLLGALVVSRWGGPVALVPDLPGAGAIAVAGLVAGAMFLPGFSYGVSDKDPGGYVAHAVEIARHGSYSFTDPALAHGQGLPVQQIAQGVRLNAIWVRNASSGLIVPQFYHLWPATLASAYAVAGFGGITGATPVIGILSVMLLVALIRRMTRSPVTAAVMGVLMATNMLQVWQAKLPSTEVLEEAFFVAGLLSLVIAVETRWRAAAGFAGILTGASFLNRADGWLLVVMGAVSLGTLWALRRFDQRAAWFGCGLLVVVPYAFFQAYGAARAYSRANAVPSLSKTLLLLMVVGVGAILGRLALARVDGIWRFLGSSQVQRRAGLALCAVAAALLVLGLARPLLFGADYFPGYHGGHVRSYDEHILWRLGWFVTLPGFVLALAGLAIVSLRRWSAIVWTALLPPLALFPIFTYHARISTQLMWWGRRYVPYALPGILLLMALAVAFAWTWRWRQRRPLRLPVMLTVLALLALFLAQSLPLRHHDEWQGSFGVTERVAALSGGRHGIFLWPSSERGTPGALFAIPVWLERDQLSVLTPPQEAQLGPYVRAYKLAFPDRPLFVVWTRPTPPPPLAGLSLRQVDHVIGRLPYWNESNTTRPSAPHRGGLRYEFAVFRVEGAAR